MPPVMPPPARTSAVLPVPCLRTARVRCERRTLSAGRSPSPCSPSGWAAMCLPILLGAVPYFYATRREGDLVVIAGADARHLAGPLRARGGERISVVGPAGFLLWVGRSSVSSREVAGTGVEARPHHQNPVPT